MFLQNRIIRDATEILELLLALAVVAGIITYMWNYAPTFISLDWRQFETFELFVQSILVVLVGIELIRLIKVHSLSDIFMMAILILMRKSLDPANTTYEIIALTVAAVVVVSGLTILSKKKLI